MTDYKKQYFKYKLKYLLLKQKNLQFKQKAGCCGTERGSKNFVCKTIDYIKNFFFPEKNISNECSLVGLDSILNEPYFEYNSENSDEDNSEDPDEDNSEDPDEIHTPPNSPTPMDTRTPPKETDNGPFGAGTLNYLN